MAISAGEFFQTPKAHKRFKVENAWDWASSMTNAFRLFLTFPADRAPSSTFQLRLLALPVKISKANDIDILSC